MNPLDSMRLHGALTKFKLFTNEKIMNNLKKTHLSKGNIKDFEGSADGEPKEHGFNTED
jgi:hypothetical protein